MRLPDGFGVGNDVAVFVPDVAVIADDALVARMVDVLVAGGAFSPEPAGVEGESPVCPGAGAASAGCGDVPVGMFLAMSSTPARLALKPSMRSPTLILVMPAALPR